jgi:uncharacterized membrane protein HdeD (DUF308 family)
MLIGATQLAGPTVGGNATVNSTPMPGTQQTLNHNPENLQEISLFLIGMGIGLTLLGTVAIGASLIATLATVLLFGFVLLLGALFQILTAFWGRHWRGFSLHLLSGSLYLVLGLYMIDNPVDAAPGLTVLVAAGLLVGGCIRMTLSALDHFEGWGWGLCSGCLSVLMGIAIWSQWPWSGLWVIGLFVGIEMVTSGCSWLMLGLAVRSLRRKPG